VLEKNSVDKNFPSPCVSALQKCSCSKFVLTVIKLSSQMTLQFFFDVALVIENKHTHQSGTR
jgi:hypothetical protein